MESWGDRDVYENGGMKKLFEYLLCGILIDIYIYKRIWR